MTDWSWSDKTTRQILVTIVACIFGTLVSVIVWQQSRIEKLETDNDVKDERYIKRLEYYENKFNELDHKAETLETTQTQ